MSIEHMAVVLHHSRAKGTAKLVLLGVANHQGDGGAWPSVETLARYANVTPRNAQAAIRRLVETGELRVWLQDGGTRHTRADQRPNRYQVVVACPAWCDRSPNHRDTRPSASRLENFPAERHPDDLAGLVPSEPVDNGVSESSPRGAHGVSIATPGGVSIATPEPSLGTTTPLPPADHRPCQDCGQDQARCQRVQATWVQEDRHPYRPADTLRAVAHTPPAPARRRRG